ncbi:hypothetical protein G6F65_022189 [Rhizopus arrhizus]|nr:hypothetical protein G6F65_022189 [Rhizopus arrhizus]
MASTGISNRIVCSHGPLTSIEISPGASPSLMWMQRSGMWNSPRKSPKSLLMKRKPPSGELMQHHLHHAEFVQIGVEQRSDYHDCAYRFATP